MGAADVGANHQRDRIWIVAKAQFANPNLQPSYAKQKCEHDWLEKFSGSSAGEMGAFDATKNVSNTDLSQRKGGGLSVRVDQEHAYACNSRWWQTEPDVGRMANGVASGVDRLKAIGNGQVPLCAATAWRLLSEL
jgi:DNA (cytosine-5)-methyltransferase 1